MSHNSNTNNNNTLELDIFTPPLPTPEDEHTINLKREAEELRAQLKPMVQSAPSDDHPMIEKQGWCDQWKLLRVSTSYLSVLTDI
jgi:hypothetical protein